MATTVTDLTTSYTKIADAGSWTSIQNLGPGDAEVYIQNSGGAAPTTGGFILKTLDAMLPSTFGDGDIYIKMRQENNPVRVAYYTE